MDEGSDSRLWPFFLRIFKGKHDDHPVEDAIREAEEDGDLKPVEVSMLQNVLHLGRKMVREIMIPRPDIFCEDASVPLDEIARLIMTSGHSRIPIYEENKDNIIGVVHAKDLINHYALGIGPNTSREIMREPFFIPETKNVIDLFQEFRLRKVHLAIAVDEYGGTSGLVTFEDVLEEIVGDIEDEYDAPRPDEIQELENRDLLVSGRTSLEDLEDEAGITLESEQVETVGGYLSEMAGYVPQPGEEFSIDGYSFKVKDADSKTVRSVIITKGPGASGEA